MILEKSYEQKLYKSSTPEDSYSFSYEMAHETKLQISITLHLQYFRKRYSFLE